MNVEVNRITTQSLKTPLSNHCSTTFLSLSLPSLPLSHRMRIYFHCCLVCFQSLLNTVSFSVNRSTRNQRRVAEHTHTLHRPSLHSKSGARMSTIGHHLIPHAMRERPTEFTRVTNQFTREHHTRPCALSSHALSERWYDTH